MIEDNHGASIQVNSKFAGGDTPLHTASAWGDTRAVELLLEAGADIMPRNEFGKTALEVAEAKGNERIKTIMKRFI